MTEPALLPGDIAAAKKILSRLCDHGHVRMCIPVQQTDEDMVLARVIAAAALSPSVGEKEGDGWISTSAKMPPEHVEVLVAISTGKTLLATYWKAIGFDWATTDEDDDMEAWVTHWMPLPKPPALSAHKGAEE